MCCLFAVSSRFVQHELINKYHIQYITKWYVRKNNSSLVIHGNRKNPTLESTVLRKTQQAFFPTGKVGPQVGIFLSPLITNERFYLSHIPVKAHGKDKNEHLHVGRTMICDVIVMLKLCHHVASHHFVEVFFMFFQYKMRKET